MNISKLGKLQRLPPGCHILPSDNVITDNLFSPNSQNLIDVVDIDPYGTCSPFLESAIFCLRPGGLLLVTSTDTRVLCSSNKSYSETVFSRYTSLKTKSVSKNEFALR